MQPLRISFKCHTHHRIYCTHIDCQPKVPDNGTDSERDPHPAPTLGADPQELE